MERTTIKLPYGVPIGRLLITRISLILIKVGTAGLLLIGFLLGWLGWGWWAEKDAIVRLEAANGSVGREQLPVPVVSSVLPARWKWFLERAEDVYVFQYDPGTWSQLQHLSHLKSLQAIDLDVGDSDLRYLSGLQLTKLDLAKTKITDAGLATISRLRDLRELDIAATQISDAGISNLVALTALQHLELGETRITDAAFPSLAKLQSLDALFLGDTRITDSGVAHLQALRRLKTLAVQHTGVTDRGMATLANISGLEELMLADTKVSDEGLKNLQGLKKLRRVVLDGTNVTAAGVAELIKSTQLREVYVEHTKVTEADLPELERASPQCDIILWRR